MLPRTVKSRPQASKIQAYVSESEPRFQVVLYSLYMYYDMKATTKKRYRNENLKLEPETRNRAWLCKFEQLEILCQKDIAMCNDNLVKYSFNVRFYCVAKKCLHRFRVYFVILTGYSQLVECTIFLYFPLISVCSYEVHFQHHSETWHWSCLGSTTLLL